MSKPCHFSFQNKNGTINILSLSLSTNPIQWKNLNISSIFIVLLFAYEVHIHFGLACSKWITTILISAVFSDAALIRGTALIRGHTVNKPASFRCRCVYVCRTFLWTLGVKKYFKMATDQTITQNDGAGNFNNNNC